MTSSANIQSAYRRGAEDVVNFSEALTAYDPSFSGRFTNFDCVFPFRPFFPHCIEMREQKGRHAEMVPGTFVIIFCKIAIKSKPGIAALFQRPPLIDIRLSAVENYNLPVWKETGKLLSTVESQWKTM